MKCVCILIFPVSQVQMESEMRAMYSSHKLEDQPLQSYLQTIQDPTQLMSSAIQAPGNGNIGEASFTPPRSSPHNQSMETSTNAVANVVAMSHHQAHAYQGPHALGLRQGGDGLHSLLLNQEQAFAHSHTTMNGGNHEASLDSAWNQAIFNAEASFTTPGPRLQYPNTTDTATKGMSASPFHDEDHQLTRAPASGSQALKTPQEMPEVVAGLQHLVQSLGPAPRSSVHLPGAATPSSFSSQSSVANSRSQSPAPAPGSSAEQGVPFQERRPSFRTRAGSIFLNGDTKLNLKAAKQQNSV